MAETTDTGAPVACRVDGLTKSYRTGFWGRRRPAVADVSFTVPRGAVIGLLGHNGAGKTTTLKAILDLVRPDAGRIELLGRDHRDRQARAGVGYLPESPYFYDYLTAGELLDFYARLGGVPARERTRRTTEVLGLVGMADHARTPLRKCSKGMLQRIGLAQALVHEPELLILDEPMSGLDPLGRKEVRDLLGELRRRGRTLLLSSHIVPDLEALADAVVMLSDGRVAGVLDLHGPATPQFELWLAELPADPRATALWAAAPPRPAGGGRAGLVVTLTDLPRLRAALGLCAEAGIAVHGVTSRQTGLEAAFLAAMGARGAAATAPGGTAQLPDVAADPAPAIVSATVAAVEAEAEAEAELVGAGAEGGRP
ncbi:MAG: ABC transporter ATP-binding protein [Candidatus Krumholzibacteriia bacterium]